MVTMIKKLTLATYFLFQIEWIISLTQAICTIPTILLYLSIILLVIGFVLICSILHITNDSDENDIWIGLTGVLFIPMIVRGFYITIYRWLEMDNPITMKPCSSFINGSHMCGYISLFLMIFILVHHIYTESVYMDVAKVI